MSLFEEAEDHPTRVACAALIVASIFGCSYALGGTSLTVINLLAVAAFLAALLALVDAQRSHQGFAGGLTGAVLVAMAVVVALQCVPIPAALLARLAPVSDDLLQFTLGPHHLYPQARPLSLDPPATQTEWLKMASYLALYAAAAQVARARWGRKVLIYAVAALGASLTLFAALHYAFDLHEVFGVEGWTRSGLITPYVDRNHLASALDLSTLVQLGLAFRTDDRRKTFAWGGLAVATGAAALMANSRAGALSLVAGAVVFVAFLGRRGEGDRRVRSTRAAVAVTLGVGALGVAVYLNSDVLLTRWASLVDAKEVTHSVVSLWPTVWPMVKAHWLTGVGRGAFEVAFSRYQTNFVDSTVTYPENIMLQLTSELGLPLGLGFLVVLAGAWVESVRRPDLSAAEAGLAAGLFAVGLHEFADFGLELTGVAVPVLVAMAALEVRPKARTAVPRRVAWAAWLALVAGAIPVALHHPPGFMRDRADLDALAKHAPAADVERAAWLAVERHPVDYVLQTTAAFADVRASPAHPGAALGWANRAMYLAPLSPWPHRAAAEALLELGQRKQAMLEYRLAFPTLKSDPGFRDDLRRFAHTPEELADAVPQDAEGFAYAMDMLAQRPNDEAAVGEIALKRLPLEEPEVLKRLAQATDRSADHQRALAIAQRNLAASDYKVEAYVEVARQQAALNDAAGAEATLREGLAKNAENLDPGGYVAVASQQAALNDAAGAEATLREGLEKSPGNYELLLELAQFLGSHHRADEAHKVLKGIGVRDLDKRLHVLDVDTNLWGSQGLEAKQLPDLREAVTLAPRAAGRRFNLAHALEHQGRLREALIVLNEGLALTPTDQQTEALAWRSRLTAQVSSQQQDLMLREAEPPDSPP